MSFVVPGLTHCEEHMNPIGLGYVCEECEKERKLKGIDADKMFEELGYKRTENRLHNVARYKKDDDNVIYFCEATSYSVADVHKSGEYCETCYGITMQELKAINKKCLELGWL